MRLATDGRIIALAACVLTVALGASAIATADEPAPPPAPAPAPLADAPPPAPEPLPAVPDLVPSPPAEPPPAEPASDAPAPAEDPADATGAAPTPDAPRDAALPPAASGAPEPAPAPDAAAAPGPAPAAAPRAVVDRAPAPSAEPPDEPTAPAAPVAPGSPEDVCASADEDGACDGLRASACTIVGTPAADWLVGTDDADIICGLGGDDRLDGRGGDDRIAGGTGDDVLRGGAGRDCLVGGPGEDRAIEVAGDDVAEAEVDDGSQPPPIGVEIGADGDCSDRDGAITQEQAATPPRADGAGSPAGAGDAAILSISFADAARPAAFPVGVARRAKVDDDGVATVVVQCPDAPASGTLRLTNRRGVDLSDALAFDCSVFAYVRVALGPKMRARLARHHRARVRAVAAVGTTERAFRLVLEER